MPIRVSYQSERVVRLREALREVHREEIVNSLTHAVGVLLSLVGLTVLTVRSLAYRDVGYTVAVSIYGLSMLSVFTSSTLHHITTTPRLKNIFLWLDHSCIYAFMAGTYTPFMLTVLKGATGAVMLCAVWGLGILGVLSKTVLKIRSDWISIPFYLLMGWMIVLVIEPFARQISPEGLFLLLAGGLCYSFGVIFFLLRVAYAHAMWHVCVLAGSALHYACVFLYANPS